MEQTTKLSYLKPIVSPAPKLHLTVLVVKREPSDVDWTRRLEDARWDVGAQACTGDHHVGCVRWVEWFAGAVSDKNSMNHICRDILLWSTLTRLQFAGNNLLLPVIHQNVWSPDLWRRNSDILDVPILRLVPPQIIIGPLLPVYIF